MDQLTKDFFSHPFPGFNAPITIPKNALETNVPFVKLDLNVDYHQLLELAKQVPRNIGIRSKYPYEDNCPRSVNWTIDILWNDGTVQSHISDIYYRKPGIQHPELIPNELGAKIKDLFDSLGLISKGGLLSFFGPHGYFRPHRDISLTKTPLSYFWIPLNQPKGNRIKFYPYGDMDIELGKVYLFNQENYTHAVLNDSDEDRYVLLGFLTDTQSIEMNNKITNAILEQYPSASQ